MINNNQRRDFIKKISALALVSAVAPKLLFAKGNAFVIPSIPNAVLCHKAPPVPEGFGVIDLHCHLSQKMYLLNYPHFWHRHFPRASPNFTRVENDEHQLKTNGGHQVMGIISTHYLPEMGIERALIGKSRFFKRLVLLLKRDPNSIAGKLEHEDMSNFTQLNNMMDQLEMQMETTNKKDGRNLIVKASNYKEFEAAILEGKIPYAHAVEGSHALGRIDPISPRRKAAYYAMGETTDAGKEAKYKSYLLTNYNIKAKKGEGVKRISKLRVPKGDQTERLLCNLQALKMRGVCLITLAHFYHNDTIIYPVEGICPNERIGHAPLFDITKDKHLTEVGKKIVKRMFELGIIVDLTHTNPLARKDVFKVLEEFNGKTGLERPVIFSHSGAQAVFNRNGKHIEYSYYNADDTEIGLVRDCRGVIGIIPEVFWLKGCDTHLPNDCNPKDYEKGIQYIIETIEYISDYVYNLNGPFTTPKTGDDDTAYDNIAIGSDFDGLADEPSDLYMPSQYGNLIEGMRKANISERNIKKIMNGNALRVLKAGWVEPIEYFPCKDEIVN